MSDVYVPYRRDPPWPLAPLLYGLTGWFVSMVLVLEALLAAPMIFAKVASLTEGFSGRDLELAVSRASRAAFARGSKEISTDDLLAEVEALKRSKRAAYRRGI